MAEAPFGHEPSGIAVKRIVAIGAILAVSLTAMALVIVLVLHQLIEPARSRSHEHVGAIPPPPRLQAHPATDLAALRLRERTQLESWGWSDERAQLAHIPIERAMALYVARHEPAAADDGGHAAVPPPPDLRARVGLDQRLGAWLPRGLIFRDAQGASVTLSDALEGRPALLVPGYYRCHTLCGVVRAGIARAVRDSGLVPGTQFNVVLIGIDPRESIAEAAAAQRSDAAAHPLAQVARWRYLTGTAQASGALARALGFRYFFDPRTGEYVHAAGAVVVSPRGAITQYLPGVEFSPLTLRLALVSASAGHIGTVVDQLLLLCCDYDSSTGRYSLLISRLLQVMGVLTLLGLGALLLRLRRAESSRRSDGLPP